MWKKTKTVIIILIFSVALNTAFGAMWAIHRLPAHLGCSGHRRGSHGESCVSCPLHRKLGTSEKQWQKIEPRLEEFKRSCQVICRKNKQLREELIDLIAAPTTDLEAIGTKQDEILAGQHGMQELLISHLLAEKEMLTPQQQKTFFNVIRQQCDCAGSSSIMNIASSDVSQTDPNHSADSSHDQRR